MCHNLPSFVVDEAHYLNNDGTLREFIMDKHLPDGGEAKKHFAKFQEILSAADYSKLKTMDLDTLEFLRSFLYSDEPLTGVWQGYNRHDLLKAISVEMAIRGTKEET
jgi:hypothetical protein